MIRAILSARAMAATFGGRRASSAVRQADVGAPRRACAITAGAPTTSSVRKTGLPILEIWPIRSLPPLECILGVKPTHAAKWRPESNACGSGTKACTVAAVIARLLEPSSGVALSRRYARQRRLRVRASRYARSTLRSDRPESDATRTRRKAIADPLRGQG